MGHVGNWSERKLALERHRASERRRAELEAERQVIHLWGEAYNFLALHPCATQQMGLQPKVTCAGCRRTEDVNLHALLRTKYGHRPWPEVMPHLRCSKCGMPPSDLVFHAKNAANLNQSDIGRLSIRPPPPGEKPPLTWEEECDPRVRSTLRDGRPA